MGRAQPVAEQALVCGHRRRSELRGSCHERAAEVTDRTLLRAGAVIGVAVTAALVRGFYCVGLPAAHCQYLDAFGL
jgi:hypothetical protein